MRGKLIVLLIILTIGVGFAGFWYWQKNTYSREVLRLEILGPSEINFGQEAEYIVKFKNQGDFRLDLPELIFEPPAHSYKNEESFERQFLEKEQLGEAIYPGEEKTISFKMRILGKEGAVKIAKAWLSYQPKGLKARFESNTTFTTVIKSVPLTFELDLPAKIESGKNFKFRIDYSSYVDYALQDLGIQIDYPSGFEFVESVPKSIDKNEWTVPVLNKSQGGRIEVTGRLSGDVGEAKMFWAKLGIWKNGEFILLKEAEKGIEIIKPLIYLRQEINGNPRYTAMPGDWLHYEIYFKNIGDDVLENLFMICKLDGELFDFQTIKSDMGDFEAGDDSVVFDWRKVQKLQHLTPVEEGKVEFWIRLKDDSGNVKNPVLTNKVFVSQVKEEFTTKIGSRLEIVQKGYFQDEIFGNGGSLPPAVGAKTSYTVTWQVKNYYSDVKDVKVRAILPTQVSLTGKIFPEEATAKFTFDSKSREIVWSVGDLERGRGVTNQPPNISFQIEFTPEEGQLGQTPELIGRAQITGEDDWTKTTLQSFSTAVDTTLPDDELVTPEMGTIK